MSGLCGNQSVIEAFFDGACEPINPGGHVGYEAIIFRNGSPIWQRSRYLPAGERTSNNVGEYCGLLCILRFLAKEKLNQEEIIVRGDSQLVINQIFGTWKVKKGFYIPLAREAKRMLESFPMISGEWIPREQNKLADDLSKSELKKRNVTIPL